MSRDTELQLYDAIKQSVSPYVPIITIVKNNPFSCPWKELIKT